MDNNYVWLAVKASCPEDEEDCFSFGVKLDWLINICKSYKLQFETIEDLQKLFKGNFELSQRVFDIANKENCLIY